MNAIMMWFFIFLGIAIVVVFVVLGYKAAFSAANAPDATTKQDSNKKRP